MAEKADDSCRRDALRIKARLKVRFKDAGAFISEYTHNISKGGLFVRTGKPCAQGSLVEVTLIIPECDKEVRAIGEVIHVVTAEQATESQPAGMGLQLRDLAHEDHQVIEDYMREKLASGEIDDGLGRRQHQRFEARIRVRFGSMEAMNEEYAHNISHGGIFIRTSRPKKLQEKVKIILTHPVTAEEMILEGEVVRVVEEAESKRTGQPAGMGVRFLATDNYTLDQLAHFIRAHATSGAPSVIEI
jgi:type IV pilus assembly protein PilZ